MPRLPEHILPDLRGKWVKLTGAREVAQHALSAAQRIESEYQTTLNTALRMIGADPGQPWRINLETGEVEEAPVETPANGVPALT